MARPLTLVCAPAGFGKTTLLAEWIGEAGPPVAWVSLDDQDNDPLRFWSYVTAALRSLDDGIGSDALAMLRAPRPPPIEVVLVGLVNELIAVDESVVLVLDDYHAVHDPAIHQTLGYLVDHLPPGCAWSWPRGPTRCCRSPAGGPTARSSSCARPTCASRPTRWRPS